jgi:hypothetical protein
MSQAVAAAAYLRRGFLAEGWLVAHPETFGTESAAMPHQRLLMI